MFHREEYFRLYQYTVSVDVSSAMSSTIGTEGSEPSGRIPWADHQHWQLAWETGELVTGPRV